MRGRRTDGIRHIELDMTADEGYDLFQIWELGDHTFVSRRFVYVCSIMKFVLFRQMQQKHPCRAGAFAIGTEPAW